MRTRHLGKPGGMGPGQDLCPSGKDASRPAAQRGRISFRLSIVWISLFLVLWASAGITADAQDQVAELTKKMEELQQKLQAAQGDPNRMMELAKEMQDLSAQMVELQAQMAGKSAAGASSGISPSQGKAHPWLVATPHGYLARPVRVTVYNRMEEAAFGRIYTGILPEEGAEFIRTYLLFDYTAKAEGALLYKEDYSDFRMDAPGDKTSVSIQALTGYAQRQVQGQKLEHEGYALGAASIVRPVHLSLFYPITDPKNVTNLHFASLEVQTSDERMPTVSGSSFPNLSFNLDLGQRFIVTPQLMEAFAEQGRIDKTFAWRTLQPNGKDYVDNLVRIQIEIGDAPEEQPGVLAVKPKEGFTSSGKTGGQTFTPQSKTYTLRNVGKSPIDFKATNDHNWLALSATGGKLVPGQSMDLKVSLTDAAKQLEEGEYKDTLTFTNTTSGKGNTTRAATLLVGAEEQTWRVMVTGWFREPLPWDGLVFVDANGQKTKIIKAVKFHWDLNGEFVIKKDRGKWVYKDGKVTAAKLKPIEDFQPKGIYSCSVWLCKVGKAPIGFYVGKPIVGSFTGNRVQLRWWPFNPAACVSCQPKHPNLPQMPYEAQFESGEFISQISAASYPLQNQTFPPVKKDGLYYTVTLKRIK